MIEPDFHDTIPPYLLHIRIQTPYQAKKLLSTIVAVNCAKCKFVENSVVETDVFLFWFCCSKNQRLTSTFHNAYL